MADAKPTPSILTRELARVVLEHLQTAAVPDPGAVRYAALLADLMLLEAEGVRFEFDFGTPTAQAAPAEGR
jgi:hypothetical protein